MYSDFYGFTGRPFQLPLDPAWYFESLSHRRAQSDLNAGLGLGEGFVVLTGEAGAGKTTLVAQLMATLDQGRLTTAHMVSSQVAGGDQAGGEAKSGQTIPAIARAFGVAAAPIPGLAAATRAPFMLDANLSFLRDEARAGRRCLLVVDEAQALPIAALETLRLISLFELNARPLLQILLIGQPELRSRLQCHPELAALRQRVVAAHHLDPLEAGEVERYIHHHLKCVGWNGNPTFDPEIHAELFTASGGVPGRINQFVDRLLLLGAAEQKAHIDATMLAQVLAERAGDAAVAGETAWPVEPSLKTRMDIVLARCEQQIAALQQAVVELGDTRDSHTRDALRRQATHYHQDSAALQERLSSLESRMIEQERTVRHTLDMMIEWIERDQAYGVGISGVGGFSG